MDSFESVTLIQLAYHQLMANSAETVSKLVHHQEQGHLYPPIDMVVDARAVFDSVKAMDICTPTECSLKLHLIAVRDWLYQKRIRFMFWCDTRDMIADAMTKGGVVRELIETAMNKGIMLTKHASQRCQKDPLKMQAGDLQSSKN